MKEKLIEALGLKADASDEAILKAVASLHETIRGQERANAELQKDIDKLLAGPAETPTAQLEKRIAAKIAQSGGALNREQALIAIEAQEANKKAPKKK